MPRCYFLAVSKSSSLDQYTNNWSLFELIGRVSLEGEQPPSIDQPCPAPFEVHSTWRYSKEEIGSEFEWRLIAIADGRDLVCSKIFSAKPQKRNVRNRVKGLRIVAPGETELRVECRKKNEEAWERCDAAWLLKVEFTQKSAAPQPLALPEGS